VHAAHQLLLLRLARCLQQQLLLVASAAAAQQHLLLLLLLLQSQPVFCFLPVTLHLAGHLPPFLFAAVLAQLYPFDLRLVPRYCYCYALLPAA
jgi:hypothetical protein